MPRWLLGGFTLLVLILIAVFVWGIRADMRAERRCIAAGGEWHEFRDGTLCLRPGVVLHPEGN